MRIRTYGVVRGVMLKHPPTRFRESPACSPSARNPSLIPSPKILPPHPSPQNTLSGILFRNPHPLNHSLPPLSWQCRISNRLSVRSFLSCLHLLAPDLPRPLMNLREPLPLPEYFSPMKPYALQTQFLGVTEGKPADIIMRNTNCGMIKGSRHCRERPWAEGAGSCCPSRSARRSCRLPDDAAGSARVFKGAAPRRGSRRRASPREITPRKQTVRRMTWFH